MFEILITFIAGLVSFLSPCVLPLVPAYIGYMGGRVTNTIAAQISVGSGGAAVLKPNSFNARFSTFLHGLAFVGGFTFIFVLLGVLSTAVLSLLGGQIALERFIGRVGGVGIIFLGLHFMGAIPALFKRLRQSPELISSPLFNALLALLGSLLIVWCATGLLAVWSPEVAEVPRWMLAAALLGVTIYLVLLVLGGAFAAPGLFWTKIMNTVDMTLYADTRREMTANGQQGFSNSALMGVVFAAGWTPCLGPTLGAALMTAAAGDSVSVARGAVLLTAYSLGLGIPFLMTALMLDSAQGLFRRLQKHMRTVQIVSGVFLIFIGYVIASGQLQTLSLRYSLQFSDFSYRLENCTVEFFEGELPFNQLRGCINGDESASSGDEASLLPAPAPAVSTPAVARTFPRKETPAFNALA
ncbi:MAG: cytochrome c biogenesis protein CcdA [bacterium]|nr:cytochrome c biogenesis protein CcdA [bacterium]